MNKELIRKIIVGICLVSLLLLLVMRPEIYKDDEETDKLLFAVLIRLLGTLIFVFLPGANDYHKFAKPSWKWLTTIPCFVIVINNYPILSFIQGNCHVVRNDLIWLFALETLLIGIFEEVAFRSVLFLYLLENRRKTGKQIFWVTVVSSAIFALFHLTNLLEGAGVGPTIMQIGYSFLIGGMCAIVLLKTGNILIPIILHAIYDFCGGLMPELGTGDWWDTPTIIITAVLSVLVVAHMLVALYHVKPEDIDKFYNKKISEEQM